ncbi:hypothetical protein [Streptomyces sp. Amel2xC10]|uniref:hypothetical protein n=1 Tax=Streptomyces sp. Amel2xC10 TaxID=1305826 RepID=UPI000A087189|nr:hypothetical protein [Streptomyces sp. Amel2xC10]SMF14393.1 hypothetical protein SAMN02745830_01814 [Streptomyces sp. Amel2xC10]
MPRDTAGIGSGDLVGTYAGVEDAEGATVVLGPLDGRGKGKVTVRGWPAGDWYRSEVGDTFDSLSVAADADRAFLYEDDDPDVCARFRLQLEK